METNERNCYLDAAELLDKITNKVNDSDFIMVTAKDNAPDITFTCYAVPMITDAVMLSLVSAKSVSKWGACQILGATRRDDNENLLVSVRRAEFGFTITVGRTFLNHPRYGAVIRQATNNVLVTPLCQ